MAFALRVAFGRVARASSVGMAGRALVTAHPGGQRFGVLLRASSTASVAVPMELVKQLRAATAAGYTDCKKALSESGNDMDKAIQWLREKGALKAASKSTRQTTEGLVGAALSPDRSRGVVVEINSESDFVARSESFQQLVRTVTAAVMNHVSTAQLPAGTHVLPLDVVKQLRVTTCSESVGDVLIQTVAKLQENISLRRVSAVVVDATSGIVVPYIHSEVEPASGDTRVGRICGMVALNHGQQAVSAPVEELAHKLAMHVVGYSPVYLSRTDVPDEVFQAHRLDFEKQLQAFKEAPKSKEEEQLGMRKFSPDRIYEEIVLADQEFLGGALKGKTVAQVIKDFGTKSGADVKLSGFVRFKAGEGLLQKTDDFASEVARLAGV